MISNVVSIGRPPWIATVPFLVQAVGRVAMAIICDLCGLLHTDTTGPASPWLDVAICHTRRTGWVSGFGDGLSMGFVMMLVSFAPLRWSGVMSPVGGVTALLWVLGAGMLQASILAADQIAPVGCVIQSAIPRLILLGLGMAAALHAPGLESSKRTPFRDGAHCFLRCGPMMIAMMLTGAMSLPWVIGGALLSQLDGAAGNLRLSRFLTCGICIAATVRIV